MVLTVLEARVQTDRVRDLKSAFEETKALPIPPFIVQSMLVRSDQDPDVWRITTVFRSREDLAAMRASGQTPRGVAMFREAGAEPTLSIFDVADHLENRTAAEA